MSLEQTLIEFGSLLTKNKDYSLEIYRSVVASYLYDLILETPKTQYLKKDLIFNLASNIQLELELSEEEEIYLNFCFRSLKKD